MAKKSLGSAAIIMDKEGKVLLVKHTYGRCNWELPGGAADMNESLEETTVREVLEETGLHVTAERLSGLYYEAASDMHHSVFICRKMDSSELPYPSSPEISECGYWSVDALPRPISSFTLKRIQDALHPEATLALINIGEREWFE